MITVMLGMKLDLESNCHVETVLHMLAMEEKWHAFLSHMSHHNFGAKIENSPTSGDE